MNQYGRATAQALVRVRQPEATDVLVIRAFKDATEEIDRAINNTLISLFAGDSSRVNPFRLARFPDAVGRAAARPAEVFERTLVNIRRMINAGISANTTNEFRYEQVLTAEQVCLLSFIHMFITFCINTVRSCQFSRSEKLRDSQDVLDTDTSRTARTCATILNTVA